MHQVKFLINKIFYFVFDKVILLYQWIISPLIPARCRYYPTCSEYGRQALSWHGPWRGGLLTVNRICRCHPWGGHGIDFVPLPLYQYHYEFVAMSTETRVKVGAYVFCDSSSYQAWLSAWLNHPI